MTYNRTLEELAKKHSDGMKIFHVSVGKPPFEEACLQAKGIETIIDQHAIKEAYEMGYKDAKEELEKKEETIEKILSFVMEARASVRELAEALYEKGFRID